MDRQSATDGQKETDIAGKRAFARYVSFLLPIIFFLIPTSWLEKHPPPCLSRLLFHRRCPGCGMTRALSCAIHGNFRKAWRYNKLFVIVLPLLAWEWLRDVRNELGHMSHKPLV